jgi:hypothetical protein
MQRRRSKAVGKDSLTADDLLVRIQAYRQTLITAPKSIRPWLDRLIADAEAQLAGLRGDATPAALAAPELTPPEFTPAAAHAAAAADDGQAAAAAEHPVSHARHGRARRTYPFDERAPFQRPSIDK